MQPEAKFCVVVILTELCSVPNGSLFLVLCSKWQPVPGALFQMAACFWCSVSNGSLFLVLCFKWQPVPDALFKWQHVPDALFKWQHVPGALFQMTGI